MDAIEDPNLFKLLPEVLPSKEVNSDALLEAANSLLLSVDEGHWEKQLPDWEDKAERFRRAYEMFLRFFPKVATVSLLLLVGCSTPFVPPRPIRVVVKAEPYPYIIPILAYSITVAGGITPSPVPTPDGEVHVGDTCPACNGTGWNEADHNPANRLPCVSCGGDGKIDKGDPALSSSLPKEVISKLLDSLNHPPIEIHVKPEPSGAPPVDKGLFPPPGKIPPRLYVEIDGDKYYFNEEHNLIENDTGTGIKIRSAPAWNPRKGAFLIIHGAEKDLRLEIK